MENWPIYFRENSVFLDQNGVLTQCVLLPFPAQYGKNIDLVSLVKIENILILSHCVFRLLYYFSFSWKKLSRLLLKSSMHNFEWQWKVNCWCVFWLFLHLFYHPSVEKERKKQFFGGQNWREWQFEEVPDTTPQISTFFLGTDKNYQV